MSLPYPQTETELIEYFAEYCPDIRLTTSEPSSLRVVNAPTVASETGPARGAKASVRPLPQD